MFTAQITVPNETGLHARPASALVRLCKQYQSSIHIRHGELDIDAKSIVRLLACGLSQHARIELVVEGEDEAEAGSAVAEFIRSLTDGGGAYESH